MELFTMSIKSYQELVWCGLSAFGLIESFFFCYTVTGANYLFLLLESIMPRIQEMFRHEKWYFQQDWAPSHFHHNVRAYLDKNLVNRWIGRRYPPCSLDLTPMDFFLWRHPKNCLQHKINYNQWAESNNWNRMCSYSCWND